MDLAERLDLLRCEIPLTDEDVSVIRNTLSETKIEVVNSMIENAIGVYPIPLGIATNFRINGKSYYVPMATEEPSVVAAASYAAKLAALNGGFKATVTDSIMRGQIQVVCIKDLSEACNIIYQNKEELLKRANIDNRTVKAIDVKVRVLDDNLSVSQNPMLIVELIVDTKDAMGANAINTMCERIGPMIEALTKGKVILKILSNYATERIAACEAILKKEDIGGKEIIERMIHGYAFAYSDPHRAVTHNKGIMNGIDAVALATGQDYRALEAGAHAYACRSGKYRSLSMFCKNENNDLLCKIELPMAVGTIGGVASTYSIAKLGLKILQINSAKELAMVLVSVGLAQNIGALRALADEGIQSGHMKLHKRKFEKG